MITARFHSFACTGGWDVQLSSPAEVRTAAARSDVLPLIRFAEESAHRGRWVALLLSYEAAPALDAALTTHAPGSFPLAWAAAFDEAAAAADEPTPAGPSSARGFYDVVESAVSADPAPGTAHTTSPWHLLIERAAYEKAIRRIREYIASGDTYQVNYTFPLRRPFADDARAWFTAQGPAQGAAWSVFVDLGRFQVLSFSPELLFEWRDGRVVCRPMKGTRARGRWFEEDEAQARAFAGSRKDRAENLMIADMVRNDLGRIAQTGSVKTSRLFEIERYPTLFQMTSTIEATPRSGVTLTDLLRALFPGASVTGAPKVRTMEIIRELEPHPRGLYTGAIGLLKPGGEAVFNLPIRTVVVDRQLGEAVFHTGGGVTWDSTAEGEYEECLLKAAFLDETAPLFSLLETMRLENGEYFLLERHLTRLRQSALYFGYPMDEPRVRRELGDLAAAHARRAWRARLQLDSKGMIRLDAEPLVSPPEPWRVALADEPVNSRSRFLYHKTTRRSVYDAALAAHPACRDVILWNERGEITESCLANVVIALDGREYTPPLSCGLLPGTMRGELLEADRITERVIRKDELNHADAVYLINSVRGRVRAELI